MKNILYHVVIPTDGLLLLLKYVVVRGKAARQICNVYDKNIWIKSYSSIKVTFFSNID